MYDCGVSGLHSFGLAWSGNSNMSERRGRVKSEKLINEKVELNF